MHKDTFWFSHDYNARSDRKMQKLRMKYKMEGIGIYWCIIEMLYEEEGYLNHLEYDRIAFELQTNTECIKSIVNDFQLFDMNDDNFWSDSIIKRLKIRKDKSNQAKEAVRVRWEKERQKKANYTTVLHPHNDRNTTKERKGYERIDNTVLVKQDENLKNNETAIIGATPISGAGILLTKINGE